MVVHGVQGSQVLFLTNCHATPWQSHIHRPDVTLTFLDCSPPGQHPAVLLMNSRHSTGVFNVAEGRDAQTEQDAFFADPLQLCDVYGGCTGGLSSADRSTLTVPHTLVMFDSMERRIAGFVRAHGYKCVARFLHNRLERSAIVIMTRAAEIG